VGGSLGVLRVRPHFHVVLRASDGERVDSLRVLHLGHERGDASPTGGHSDRRVTRVQDEESFVFKADDPLRDGHLLLAGGRARRRRVERRRPQDPLRRRWAARRARSPASPLTSTPLSTLRTAPTLTNSSAAARLIAALVIGGLTLSTVG